jgi:hypothetical protein
MVTLVLSIWTSLLEVDVVFCYDKYRLVPEHIIGQYQQTLRGVVYVRVRWYHLERADEMDSFEREERAGSVPLMCD